MSMGAPVQDVEERLMKKVILIPFCECWIWSGSTNRKGYGSFGYGPKCKPIGAHRVSYLIFNGSIPDKLQVLHKCDTPSCINPKHLFLGTHQENMNDMVSKGRANRQIGENNKGAKLTKAQAEEIKISTLTTKELVIAYNISKSAVLRIKTGLSWAK